MKKEVKKVEIPKSYELYYPIESKTGEKITVLNFARINAKEYKEVISQEDSEKDAMLLAISAGLTPEDVEKIDAADYIQAVAVASSFLLMNPKTEAVAT